VEHSSGSCTPVWLAAALQQVLLLLLHPQITQQGAGLLCWDLTRLHYSSASVWEQQDLASAFGRSESMRSYNKHYKHTTSSSGNRHTEHCMLDTVSHAQGHPWLAV
jgi:hypothetical protein